MEESIEKLLQQAYQRGYYQGFQAGYQKAESDFSCGENRKSAPGNILELPIQALGLSTRVENCLIRAGCNSIHDVVNLSDRQTRCTRHMGPAAARDVAKALEAYNIHSAVWMQYLIPDDNRKFY